MYEVIFLWFLALIYIVFAVIQDIKTREIADWISFSLIIFALGFRIFFSVFSGDFSFLFNGLIGLGIFFIIGNLMYYGKVFAGGDAKLMIALGAVLPYYPDFLSNVQISFNFLFTFLVSGFVYIFISSIVLGTKNFRKFGKEFARQMKKTKKLMIVAVLSGIIFLLLGFLDILFLALGVSIFFIAYLYLYSKAVDESCMIIKIKSKNLREGDWLYSDVKIGKKLIKAKWEGVSKNDIKNITRRFKEIKIRQGIPFSPVFLISFIILVVLLFLNIELWNSFW